MADTETTNREQALEASRGSQSADGPTGKGKRALGFWIAVLFLVVTFALPLYHLIRFSLGSHLFSHIVLIPAISGYLVWIKQKELKRLSRSSTWTGSGEQQSNCRRAWGLSVSFLAFGVVLITGYWFAIASGRVVDEVDRLAWTTASFLCFLVGVSGLFLKRSFLRAITFPLGFLIFMIPFPLAVQAAIETFLQHGSATVALGMFKLAGMPVFNQDLVFQLPGFSMEVAPECSGIRSSLVLFITGVLAGHLFLQSRWKQGLLAAFVIPLALLRNGFRVFVIGELCVNIGPEMIDSPIHRQGGPLFFALSLIPFAILLFVLWRSERRAQREWSNGGLRENDEAQ